MSISSQSPDDVPSPPAFPVAATLDGAAAAQVNYPIQLASPNQDATEPPFASRAARTTSRLAEVSVFCAVGCLLAFLFLPALLLSLPAVVCGHLALWRIARSHGRLMGTGRAVTGLVIGYLALALTLYIGYYLVRTAFPASAL